MIDGTYSFEVEVPFGRKTGSVTLRTEGDVAYADIDAPIIGKQHMEGQVEGDTFTAQGSKKIKLVGTIDYTLKGELIGDILHITLHTSKGDYELDGVRV